MVWNNFRPPCHQPRVIDNGKTWRIFAVRGAVHACTLRAQCTTRTATFFIQQFDGAPYVSRRLILVFAPNKYYQFCARSLRAAAKFYFLLGAAAKFYYLLLHSKHFKLTFGRPQSRWVHRLDSGCKLKIAGCKPKKFYVQDPDNKKSEKNKFV